LRDDEFTTAVVSSNSLRKGIMKNINENEFEKELEKIKNSKIELKPTKQKQGEKNYEKFEKSKLQENY